jgi:hypothetical protein
MPEITRPVYNLGNPILSNWMYNYQRRNSLPTPTPTPTPPEIDIVIVGGGITGTYMARRLSSQFPLLRILLIEKTERIGGRLLSSYLGPQGNPLETALEYGGMRIFPSIQPRITKLIEMLDLTKVPVPYVSPNNLFSGRTYTFLNNQLFPNTNEVYFLESTEASGNVFTTINDNIYATFEQYGLDPSPFYEARVLAFKNSELSRLSFCNEVTEGPTPISTENYRRYANITGYTDFFYGKGSYTALAYENISLNDFDTTQFFIQKGYEQVPINCIDPFTTISFDDLKNKTYVNNDLLLMETELLKFSPTNDNKVEIKVFNGTETLTLKTSKLFITTPTISIQSIEGFPDEYCNKLRFNLGELQLFKIFLYYDTNWWSDLGFSVGRSTTDMPIDQVWFYNENTLMVYAVINDADFWGAQLPTPEQISLIDVTGNNPPAFLTYLMSFITKVFKDSIAEVPFPDKIGWKYWLSGGAFWNGLNITLPGKNIYELENEMINVFGINGNVNYISNDISLNQGWTEGSLEIVDQFLLDKYNMPGILEIDSL